MPLSENKAVLVAVQHSISSVTRKFTEKVPPRFTEDVVKFVPPFTSGAQLSGWKISIVPKFADALFPE